MNVEPLRKSSLRLKMLTLDPSDDWDVKKMIGEITPPCIDLRVLFIILLLGHYPFPISFLTGAPEFSMSDTATPKSH